MAQLLAPQLVYEVPQTREFIEGVEGFVDFFATWPQPWRVELLRCVAQAGQVAVEMRFQGEVGPPQTCVGFYELQDGRIVRIVEYWPEPYEPPPRHSRYLQRRPG